MTSCRAAPCACSYLPDVLGDGVQNQHNNPEVEVDTQRENFVVNQQLLQLKLVTNKLRHAHRGDDVDWIDTSEYPLEIYQSVPSRYPAVPARCTCTHTSLCFCPILYYPAIKTTCNCLCIGCMHNNFK